MSVRHLIRALPAALAAAATAACGSDLPTRTQPTGPAVMTLDRAKVIDALDYWQQAAGISYVLTEQPSLPRMLVRPGTDGLGPQGGGRAGPDGTYPNDNQLSSGLVIFEPGGGQYCAAPNSQLCRYLYRHEVGHALGFFDHTGVVPGLMQSGSDQLAERERRMIAALYALPHGSRVNADGSWRVPETGESGVLDVQVAQDIIAWNITASGGASYRSRESISRWQLPVQVYLVSEWR